MNQAEMQPQCYSYIRFSSPEQSKGDSLRRQLDLSETYAKKNSLELDKNLSMHDLGLSGFTGKHRTKGALGQFLQLVHAGRIPEGSVLIVESLDRLSREDILTALALFTDIIKSGIKIVTLADNREFTEDSVIANPMDLMMSLVVLSRGHEESLTKSKRLKAAWNGKRQKIHKEKLTARCPAWLRLSEDRTTFHLIPQRAEIVQRIFDMKLQGIGTGKIAQLLNEEEDTWNLEGFKGKKGGNLLNGWRKSYIDKIIRNRSVLGEHQPYSTTAGKRQPVGDPIKDYFPAVISSELFFAVQDQLSKNTVQDKDGGRKGRGGRTGKVSNLFSYIAKCGYCGATMQKVNKGPNPENEYLACGNAKRGYGCKYHGVRYSDFEKTILTYCEGLNVSDILPDSETAQTELQALQNKLAAIKGQIAENEKKINNLADSISTTSDKRIKERLDKNLTTIFNQQEEYEKQEKAIQQDIKKLSSSSKNVQAQIHSVRELLALLESKNGEELVEIRTRLRNKLRNLISKIVVYPVGMKKAIIQKSIEANDNKAIVQQVKTKLEKGDYDNKEECAFSVFFETGNYRVLAPYQPFQLATEFDREKGRTISIGYGADGELTIDKNLPNSNILQ
jgi:DNA invertase Pin-like site-specific DNA recombinase